MQLEYAPRYEDIKLTLVFFALPIVYWFIEWFTTLSMWLLYREQNATRNRVQKKISSQNFIDNLCISGVIHVNKTAFFSKRIVYLKIN